MDNNERLYELCEVSSDINPERKLYFALLKNVIEDLQKEEYREQNLRWLAGKVNAVITFEDVCNYLDLDDYKSIRKGILRLAGLR